MDDERVAEIMQRFDRIAEGGERLGSSEGHEKDA
jgi:hypothetical protein